MPLFKVSDESHSHPKVVMAGDAAWGMWNRAGCFSTHYGMDGFVPGWWVKQQPQGAAKAKRLVAAELWHPGEYEGNRPEYRGQKGYNFHEWRQDLYDKVEADREKARRKKAGQRGASPPVSPGDTTGDSQGDSPGESARSPGYVPITPYPIPEEHSGYVDPQPHQSDARTRNGTKLARQQFANLPVTSVDGLKMARAYSESLTTPLDPKALGEVSEQATYCLQAGYSPQQFAAGIREWQASDSWSPTQIRSFVQRASRPKTRPSGVGKPTEKALGWEAAGAEIIAEMERSE